MKLSPQKNSAKIAHRSADVKVVPSSLKKIFLVVLIACNASCSKASVFFCETLTSASTIASGAEIFFMTVPKIKTYNSDSIIGRHDFFILSKGNNAGKPGNQPWTNCFIAQCNSDEQHEFFYWLCFGLWKCKRFEYFLVGSVVPFIRKHDLEWEIDRAAEHVQQHHELYNNTVSRFNSFVNKREEILNLLSKQYQLHQYSLLKLVKP